MSETKHTPGPWTYGVRLNGTTWLSLGDPTKGSHRQADIYAREEDVRLICAAPELLAALKAMTKKFVNCARGSGSDQWAIDTATEDARAAISKAEAV